MTIDIMRMGDGFQLQLSCDHEVTGGEMKCIKCGTVLDFKPEITAVGHVDFTDETKI